MQCNLANNEDISTKKVKPYYTKIIYNHDENINDNTEYDIIVHKLLKKIFTDIAKPKMTTKEILKEIENKTGYLILEINKINNYASKIMYEARRIASSFDNNDKIVFHGTTLDNAKKICENGFLLQEIKRSMFGVGIYTALYFFLALYYAKPNKDDYKQTVIIADLLEGPTAIGTKGQTDFGRDSNNNPIMTLTDQNKGILCSRSPDNINVTYTFTVQYKNIADYKTSVEIPTHLNNVKYFHPDIYNIIKNNIYIDQTKNIFKSTSVPIAIPKPLISTTSSKAPKETIRLNKVGDIKEGDIVIINNTYKEYRCLSLLKKYGTVKYICSDVRTLVYISMHDENDRENIKNKNIELNNVSRMNKLTKKNTPDLTEEKTKEFNTLFCAYPQHIKVVSSVSNNNHDYYASNAINNDCNVINNDCSSNSKRKYDDNNIDTSNKYRKVDDNVIKNPVIVID